MSSRLFQSIILQMKEASDRIIGVIDVNGAVIACSELSLIGQHRDVAAAMLADHADSVMTFEGHIYKPLDSHRAQYDFALFVQGEDEKAMTTCLLAAVALNSVKNFYDERHDKATLIKNIITDNVLPGDIYIRSRELHLTGEQPRVVLLIRQNDKVDLAAVDVLQSLFPDRQRDFVISMNEADIVLVKEANNAMNTEDLYQLAQAISETLNSELLISTTIGVGSVVHQLSELASSFKEAEVAIEVGRVFDSEKSIIHYANLGIGRLIYQLPTTLCEMYLGEVFKKNSIDSLDSETLYTIQKFFENNLNVSETSRKLFVHRNTLVYRLEKIKKLTGLDLREFDHAIIFKVALMVKKYLASRES